jgi:hypothetical protein
VDILRQVDRVPLIEKRLNVSAEGRDTGECSGPGIHQIAATVIQLVPGIVGRGFKDGELLLLFVVHVDVVEGSANIRNRIMCGDSLPVRVDGSKDRVDPGRRGDCRRNCSGNGAAGSN